MRAVEVRSFGPPEVLTPADLPDPPGDRSRLMKLALDELAQKRIAPLIGQTFPLAGAAAAHRAIEARQTIAKTLLLTAA